MVYDDQPDDNPLGLHLPEVRALASSMRVRPSEEIQDHIVALAEAMLRNPEYGDVNPYWLHAEVHQTHREVTIDQVAWVLLVWVQIRRQR